MKKILLDPTSVAGGGSASPSSPPERQLSTQPDPRTDSPPAEPRQQETSPEGAPAAETVLNGEHSERELQLQDDLRKANERAEKAEGTVKDREIQNAELQDKIDRLTAPPAQPTTSEPAKQPFRLRRIRC